MRRDCTIVQNLQDQNGSPTIARKWKLTFKRLQKEENSSIPLYVFKGIADLFLCGIYDSTVAIINFLLKYIVM